jgi:hypothetical protein
VSRNSAVLVMALAACALGGCRSDGGFDRQDNMRNLSWAADRCATRTREDAAKTVDTLSSIPQDLSDSFTHGTRAMSDTYHLYFENH